jgi:hypothetical protein
MLGHVSRVGEINAYQILVRKHEGSMLVECTRVENYYLGVSLSGLGLVIGCCECGSELPSFTKGGKLFDYRHDY